MILIVVKEEIGENIILMTHIRNKTEEQNQEDVRIDSLDDLFEDTKVEENVPIQNNGPMQDQNSQPIQNIPPVQTNINPPSSADMAVLPGFEDDVAKQMQNTSEDEIDIQKELEAKFDELFGPINNNNEQ